MAPFLCWLWTEYFRMLIFFHSLASRSSWLRNFREPSNSTRHGIRSLSKHFCAAYPYFGRNSLSACLWRYPTSLQLCIHPSHYQYDRLRYKCHDSTRMALAQCHGEGRGRNRGWLGCRLHRNLHHLPNLQRGLLDLHRKKPRWKTRGADRHRILFYITWRIGVFQLVPILILRD